jgi:hypothetical protein
LINWVLSRLNKSSSKDIVKRTNLEESICKALKINPGLTNETAKKTTKRAKNLRHCSTKKRS